MHASPRRCRQGPCGRWDHVAPLDIEGQPEGFASLSADAVLAGGNAALLEAGEGWELIQFRKAELTGSGSWRLTGLLRGQGGSASGAATVGARLVVLDGAVQRAEVSGFETGMALIWKASGGSQTQTVQFNSCETLPWRPCHLRVRAGVANWLRRGRDIADSWTFPDAPNSGRFAAEFDSGAGFSGGIETGSASCAVPPGTIALRVAEIGPDGRRGPWLSIGPGSPYL